MYGVLAFAVISQIVSLLRLNFGRDSQYPMSHSSYTNLYLDLIGFVFFNGHWRRWWSEQLSCHVLTKLTGEWLI